MTENASHVLDSVQRLTDPRRYNVPVTVVATEFTAEDVRRWMSLAIDPARELAQIPDVTLVDLPSGRWTQMERPNDLSSVLASTAQSTRVRSRLSARSVAEGEDRVGVRCGARDHDGVALVGLGDEPRRVFGGCGRAARWRASRRARRTSAGVSRYQTASSCARAALQPGAGCSR